MSCVKLALQAVTSEAEAEAKANGMAMRTVQERRAVTDDLEVALQQQEQQGVEEEVAGRLVGTIVMRCGEEGKERKGKEME